MRRVQVEGPWLGHAGTTALSPSASSTSLILLCPLCLSFTIFHYLSQSSAFLQVNSVHARKSWNTLIHTHTVCRLEETPAGTQAVTILDTADLLHRAKVAIPRGNCFHIIQYITQSFPSVFLSLFLSLIITSFSWHCPFHPTMTY